MLTWARLGFAEEPNTTGAPSSVPEADSSEGSVDTAAPKDPLEPSRSRSVQKDVVPASKGLSIALRLGWGAPQGSVRHGTPLSEAALGIAPLWLDLGYRVTERWLFGIYAHYAFVIAANCPGTEGCHASDVRFGLQAQWHFGGRQAVDHWVGLGTGFEVYERKTGGITERLGGFEFANLQVGEDLPLGRRFSLGPFVSLSLDEFVSVLRLDSSDVASDSSIGRKALHGWMLIGVRLSFGA